MTDVILDTNALLMPFQFDLNLDSELERLFGDPDVYVPTCVTLELQGLGRKDALQLSKKYREVSVEKRGDRGVLEAAERLNGAVVTNDKELKREARERRIPVVFLRSKSHLVLMGEEDLDGDMDDEKLQANGHLMTLEGKVTSGAGEGSDFLALKGYKEQIKELYDMVPFEGTLNIELDHEYLNNFEHLKEREGHILHGFEKEDESFGKVTTFPSKLQDEDCITVIPEKSRYEQTIEVIAPSKLREKLDLEDGQEVKLLVYMPKGSTQ